jgi:ferredoxin/flavodoxin---NADP+ reductase
MTFVITRTCCNDATCVSVCPVNCIYPDQCIDCGVCVDACPVEAIAPDFDLPEGVEQFLDISAKYYEDPAHLDYAPVPVRRELRKITVTQDGPLRIAIVGSGPAASYAAEALLDHSELAVARQHVRTAFRAMGARTLRRGARSPTDQDRDPPVRTHRPPPRYGAVP